MACMTFYIGVSFATIKADIYCLLLQSTGACVVTCAHMQVCDVHLTLASYRCLLHTCNLSLIPWFQLYLTLPGASLQCLS